MNDEKEVKWKEFFGLIVIVICGAFIYTSLIIICSLLLFWIENAWAKYGLSWLVVTATLYLVWKFSNGERNKWSAEDIKSRW